MFLDTLLILIKYGFVDHILNKYLTTSLAVQMILKVFNLILMHGNNVHHEGESHAPKWSESPFKHPICISLAHLWAGI